MTLTVHKFALAGRDEETIDLPAGAEILKVDRQDETIQLWALVTVLPPIELRKEPRTFIIRGTGHPITHERRTLTFVGTFFYGFQGSLVFHVFEVKR